MLVLVFEFFALVFLYSLQISFLSFSTFSEICIRYLCVVIRQICYINMIPKLILRDFKIVLLLLLLKPIDIWSIEA